MDKIDFRGQQLFFEIVRKPVKNVNMRLGENGIVKISANRRVSEKQIKSILEKHADKFLRAIELQKSRKEKQLSTNNILFLGREYPVRIFSSDTEGSQLCENTLKLYLNDINDSEKTVRLISEWKLQQCIEVFNEIDKKVREAFRQAGYAVPDAKITIKSMKTRWGSCNYVKSKLSMNSRLIDYPYQCIYGVFCHEYAHFIHHDHSEKFYKCICEIFPDYKKFDRLLKST